MKCFLRCAPFLLAASIGCRGGASRGRPSIFLISIDTLRADHLPVYGYRGVSTPNIDRLARESVVFENAYSHVPLTLPSHVTMFTGRLPYESGVRDNLGYSLPKNVPTAAELLRARGYATGAAVSASVLDPSSGIDRGFDVFDAAMGPAGSAQFAERSGGDTRALLTRWIAAHGAGPMFTFLHLYEPHAPYDPPEPFRGRYAALPYDGEIAAADAVVGEFLDFLRARGLFDRSIVILLSDHGEGLGEHGEQEHGVLLYREDLHVPLLMRLPGGAFAGRRVTKPIGLIDVFPTLVEAAGASLPPGLSSRSLRAAMKTDDDDRRIYAETLYPRLIFGWSDLASLVDSRFQYIDSTHPELYDLRQDPGELHAIDPDRADAGRSLRRSLMAIHRPFAAPGASDPERVRRLASLGYLSATATTDPSGPRPDPRERIASFEKLKDAGRSVEAGHPGEAIPVVAAFQRENPRYSPGWTELAHLQEAVGDFAGAEQSLRSRLRVSSGTDEETTAELARLMIRKGDGSEAEALASRLAPVAPKSAAILRARIALSQGSSAQAAQALATIDPHDAEAASRELAGEAEKQGRPEVARRLLDPFRDSQDSETINARGVSLSELGLNPAAIDALRRGVELDPRNALLHQSLGIAFLRADQPAPAITELETAIRLDGDRVEAWNALGVARREVGASAQALDAWRQALRIDPRRYDCLFNISVVALGMGDLTTARDTLEKFVSSAPPREYGADIRKAREMLRRLAGRKR
jgi:choline-sulfatase